MSQYDLAGLYQFLHTTPEKGLRKMLVDPKSFGDVHFGLLMKVVRGCDESNFVSHYEKADFPKMRFGPAEEKVREKFWKDCEACFLQRGILTVANVKKAS